MRKEGWIVMLITLIVALAVFITYQVWDNFNIKIDYLKEQMVYKDNEIAKLINTINSREDSLEVYAPGWQKDYIDYLNEWNSYVQKGQYPQRINDELLILPTGQKIVEKVVSAKKTPAYSNYLTEYTYEDTDIISVIIIDTTEKEVYRKYVDKKLIRDVKSNWGLTQDIEQINKKLEKNKLK